MLRSLPLSFVPLLLVEVIAYDSKFPAERREIDAQFVYVRSFAQRASVMRVRSIGARIRAADIYW